MPEELQPQVPQNRRNLNRVEPLSALKRVGKGIDQFEVVNKFRRRKMYKIAEQSSGIQTKLDLSELSDLEEDLSNNGGMDASITQEYFDQVLVK